MKQLLALFFLIALFTPAGASAAVLCFTDFECPDGPYTCEDVGSYAGGMGICRSSEIQEEGGVLKNPLKSDSLIDLFLTVLRGVVRVLSVFLVVAFVYVGYQFAAAQGNSEKLSQARMSLLWTVVGAAILLGAEGIAHVITATGASLAP